MAPGIQRDEWRNRRRHIDFTDVGNLPEFVSESRHRSGYERRLLGRVSDAGRLRDVAASSAAGVRKPPKEETALGGRRTMPHVRAKSRQTTFRRSGRSPMGI